MHTLSIHWLMQRDSFFGYYKLALDIVVQIFVYIVGLQPLWELPGCNLKPAPLIRGQGETEETDHSRSVASWQV